MYHYFVIDYGNTGDFYSIGVEGEDVEAIRQYFEGQSRNVRFLKTVDKREVKTYKDIGIGKIFSCRYLRSIPKGLKPDRRDTIL